MGVKIKIPSEGGSGGKRGHSNMEHWDKTDPVKRAARRKRRQQDKSSAQEQLEDQPKDLGKP